MIKTGKKNEGQSGDTRSLGNSQQLIDRKHLSEFAMGDKALEHRFLRLFLKHADTDLARMRETDVRSFRRAVHSLKSSASSIGAWGIVAYVDHILDMEVRFLEKCQDEILEELSRKVGQVMASIHQITG